MSCNSAIIKSFGGRHTCYSTSALAKGELSSKALVYWLRSRRILRLKINVPGERYQWKYTHHPSSAVHIATPQKTDFYPMKPRITAKTAAPPSASSAGPLPPIVHAIGGSIGSALAILTFYPLERIRVEIQSQQQQKKPQKSTNRSAHRIWMLSETGDPLWEVLEDQQQKQSNNCAAKISTGQNKTTTTLIVGNQLGYSADDEKLLIQSPSVREVSLGSLSLLTSQCITITHHYLDRHFEVE
mmetsp:Transcript_5031/g.10591  ORF Transcript_5031/g.10591 Transcript_5031/m.10591 type:complete len:242 (+) Transcript_5031:77-802(+)